MSEEGESAREGVYPPRPAEVLDKITPLMIQIADFAKGSGSWHVENQSRFLAATDFRQPFSVEANRPLLSNPTAR